MSNLEQSTCQLCVKIVELKQETVVISFLICGILNFYLMALKMTTSVMITMCWNRLVLSMDVCTIFLLCSLLYLYFCQIVLVTCTVYCMSHAVYCVTQAPTKSEQQLFAVILWVPALLLSLSHPCKLPQSLSPITWELTLGADLYSV